MDMYTICYSQIYYKPGKKVNIDANHSPFDQGVDLFNKAVKVSSIWVIGTGLDNKK
jgi:hypothetical protein